MNKFKLNDEQLSRVMSAHESGQLGVGGRDDFGLYGYRSKGHGRGCLLQVACNEPDVGVAMLKDRALAYWFDRNYMHTWTTDEFLNELKKGGFVK